MYLITDCGRLIQKMLQTDPSKRLSLAKVLEHQWMKKSGNLPPASNHSPNHPPAATSTVNVSNQSSDSNTIQWDEHVLQVMRSMSINTEQAKQVCRVTITMTSYHFTGGH